MLIHKAPWVFSGQSYLLHLRISHSLTGSSGIWKLIRGWMDPEIAAKVQFTNSVADLEKFISRDQIVEEMGGDEKWSYEYVEPDAHENDRMNDTTTRDALKAEREAIG